MNVEKDWCAVVSIPVAAEVEFSRSYLKAEITKKTLLGTMTVTATTL